jgi:transcriptional regulator with XRE-family HTH domain
MDLAKRIYYFVDALGLSVNNLADRSGITQSTLQKIVTGESSTAQVSTIEKICEGLEITLEDFFREQDDLPAPALQELKQYKEFLRWKYNQSR